MGRVARLLIVYVLICAAVIFAASWLTLELGLPDWVPPGVIVLLLIGLLAIACSSTPRRR